MAHERAWRNLASRPISPQIFSTKARPEAKPAPDALSTSTQADRIPDPDRERAKLPAAMMVMVGVSFGGVLGLAGWPVLQAFGVVKEPVIETVQRSQADLIARLDSTVADLSARVASTGALVMTLSGLIGRLARLRQARSCAISLDGRPGTTETSPQWVYSLIA